MVLQIKQWESKYLKDFDVVKNGEVSQEYLYHKLTTMYYEYVGENSIVPFVISYGGVNGFMISANSHVGIIINNDVTLFITSMIPDLSLGKILYLQSQAQETENLSVTKQFLTEKLNDEEEVAAIDYFVISLIEAVEDIKQAGLITQLVDANVVSTKLQGRLDVSQQIRKNPAFDTFHAVKTISNKNNLINATIKAAIVKAVENTKLEWLVSLLRNAEEVFEGVDILESISPEDFPNISDYTSMHREDYVKALRIAKFILFGYDPLEGNGASFFPEFMVDMNEVFEFYVTASLERIFKQGFKKKARFTLGVGPEDIPIDRKNIELDGYYCVGEKSVILDTKNKYKAVLDRDIPDFIAANPDIYQQYYYASRLNSKNIILVYPSSKKRTRPIGEYELNFHGNKKVKMYFWALYITGSPMDNLKYLVSLAKFIEAL